MPCGRDYSSSSPMTKLSKKQLTRAEEWSYLLAVFLQSETRRLQAESPLDLPKNENPSLFPNRRSRFAWQWHPVIRFGTSKDKSLSNCPSQISVLSSPLQKREDVVSHRYEEERYRRFRPMCYGSWFTIHRLRPSRLAKLSANLFSCSASRFW